MKNNLAIPAKKLKGMTLTELLVVLAIMGILILLASGACE